MDQRANGGSGDGATWPVRAVGDQYDIQLPDGRPVAITPPALPEANPPGWRPLFVYPGFAPIYLLELRHEDGREATWFLDRRFVRIGIDDPAILNDADLTVLCHAASLVLARLWDQLLDANEPEPDPEVAGFLALGPAIRGRLARLCEADAAPRTVPLDLETARRRNVKVFHTCRGATLDMDVLWRMLSSDLVSQSLEAMRAGHLDWESPAGGAALTCSGGIWLSDRAFAYRVVPDRHDGCFYVLTGGLPAQVTGVLFPADRVVFTTGRRLDHIDQYHHVPIDTLLFRHLCQFGDRMLEAWRDGTAGFSVVFGEPDLAGQLRHDLTGLDQLVRHLSSHWLPEIIGLWGKPGEIYGDTEALFPATRGRVNRTIDDTGGLIRHAYQQRRILLSTTGSAKARDLCDRLLEAGANDPGVAADLATLGQIQSIGCPLVLLGLGFEQRTAAAATEYCARVIDHLMRRCGQVAIVLDGHNPGWLTAPDPNARDPLRDTERLVVRALRERYEIDPVILIDNVGLAMARSLAWCGAAHFFVAMDATGLAKYHWVRGQTGVVVTGQRPGLTEQQARLLAAEFDTGTGTLTFVPEQDRDGLRTMLDELLDRTCPHRVAPMARITRVTDARVETNEPV